METKTHKEYYIKVKGQKVAVSEEVYRAYMRPIASSQRKERRESKCLVKGKRSGIVRCTKDCSQCPYYVSGNKLQGGVLSLDALTDDGYEKTADMDIEQDFIQAEENAEQIAMLHEAIEQLNERQRYIVKEVYLKGIPQKQVAERLGITKSSLCDALRRALAALKKILQ